MTEHTPQSTRIFQIGTVRITEDASMRGKSIDEIRALLKHLYPQVEHAKVEEQTDGDTTTYTFKPPAGRKG